jgi:5-methyltetrahydropteroyltriglutamate--homocysteine methyltransferase
MGLPAGLPLIPTTVIGSHAAPGWFHTVLDAIGRGDYGATDVEEAINDAAALAIADQEQVGIDIVSEGEVRRSDFIMGFYRRLAGIEATPPHRRLGPYLYDSIEIYETAGRVTAPRSLGTVEEFKTGLRYATRPVKVAVAGPLTLTNAIRVGEGYGDRSELAADLAEVVAAELKALVDAGCRVIQVDEPSYSAYWAKPEEGVALFNRCVERSPTARRCVFTFASATCVAVHNRRAAMPRSCPPLGRRGPTSCSSSSRTAKWRSLNWSPAQICRR